MTNKLQRTFMLCGAAAVALTVFGGNARSASAAIVMRRAVAVDVDNMGTLSGASFLGGVPSAGTNMLDRGGFGPLGPNRYVDNQDQATYLAGNPKHWDGSSTEWFSAAGTTSGTVDFDLGAVYNLANVVIWNEDVFGIREFNILTSNSSTFSSGVTDFGLYKATNQAVTAVPNPLSPPGPSYLETAQKFDLRTPTAAQFVRLLIKNTYSYDGPNRDFPGLPLTTAAERDAACVPTLASNPLGYCAASIGHVAFGVDNIPTPALLPGLIGLGATAWRKRRQLAAK